jgi:hypothetical protein
VVDLDLALVLVETVDLVAVAVGDLELADLVAFGLELVLEGFFVLPLRALGGGALRAGDGQGILRMEKLSADVGDFTVQNQP